jgi:hypothetical protein
MKKCPFRPIIRSGYYDDWAAKYTHFDKCYEKECIAYEEKMTGYHEYGGETVAKITISCKRLWRE